MADRWVREHLSIQLPLPVGSRSVELQLHFPGEAGYRYPLGLDIIVNGEQKPLRVEKQGALTASYPMPPAEGSVVTAEIQIRPRSGFPTFDERNSEDEVRRLSFRLESIRFR
jgi:hypothetical protein